MEEEETDFLNDVEEDMSYSEDNEEHEILMTHVLKGYEPENRVEIYSWLDEYEINPKNPRKKVLHNLIFRDGIEVYYFDRRYSFVVVPPGATKITILVKYDALVSKKTNMSYKEWVAIGKKGEM